MVLIGNILNLEVLIGNILDLVLADVCPMDCNSLGRPSLSLMFIDDNSRKVCSFVLNFKDQVLDVFKLFHVSVERKKNEESENVSKQIMVVSIKVCLKKIAKSMESSFRRKSQRRLSIMES